MPFNARHWNLAAATALLILLLFQSAGWRLGGQIRQWEAKSAARAVMNRPETPLETLTVARKLLLKIRVDDHEIRYEGRLYDIKSQKLEGDSVTLTLYHDRREEAILDAIAGLIAPDRNRHALPLQQWLARWLGMAFLVPLTDLPPFREMLLTSSCFTCPTLVAQTAPGCFSPPPERSFFHDVCI